MATKTIIAVIERSADDGYGIYCPDLSDASLYGYGITEDEAKENFLQNFDILKQHYIEENIPVPDILKGKAVFDYRYDFSGFFKAYPFFNVSELALAVGINPSLMRRYKQGLALASPEQKKKIEAGIHQLAERLREIRF